MKKAFVTGARGFLGTNLISRLKSLSIPYVRFDAVDGDKLHNIEWLQSKMSECDFVFHLAANADIRNGWSDPQKDLTINTVGTSNVLEAMRVNGITQIAFASSSAVYGEAINPVEDCPWPTQTSLYGASKVAGEALCQAYSEGKGFKVYILRFVPLLGEGYRHGHVFDFVRQLLEHPQRLDVFGDGTQRKSYVYVQDAITAVLGLIAEGQIGAWNIGTPETCCVNDSIKIITNAMECSPIINYSGGERGWIGDAPNLNPNPKKLYGIGWRPTKNIEQSLRRTVEWMMQHKEIFA
jgi:UDP-glucose 4-epimerase